MWEAARRFCPLLTFVVLAVLLVPTTVLAQSGQVVEFYHLDALGSVRAISNQQGQIVSRHEFLPFGEEWTPAAPQRENKLFTGKERDPETGLDYFGARFFDQKIGRFTTIDPVHTWKDNLADPQRWNRYAYVTNNPLRYVDPDGRDRMGMYEPGQRGAAAPWRGLWQEAKSIGQIAVGVVAPLFAPEVASAAVGCFLSPACQQAGLDLISPPGSSSFNDAGAARTLGFAESAGATGTMIGGELRAGGSALVSVGQAGDRFLANVSMVNGPAGTLGRLEAGLVALARQQGASTLQLTASMVTASMARLLRGQGFTPVMQDGKETGNWVKTIVLTR